MKFLQIFCYFLLATSTMGEAAGKTAQATGAGVEYASWGVRKVADAALYTTETAGYYVKEAGQGLENSCQWVNNQATNALTKEEYRDLYFAKPYEFKEKVVENDWILIN